MDCKIHALADVQSSMIGSGTTIWQFCVILSGARIGTNCNINCNVLVENDVLIGNNVTIKPGVQIWNGVTIEDDVFIGPNVTFTNDLLPRSKSKNWKLSRTNIRRGASIGANATILAGVELGQFSLLGAGSVLTKSMQPFSVWYGNPASHKGYITGDGILLDLSLVDNETGKQFFYKNNQITDD